MVCPKCKCENCTVQTITEKEKVGLLKVLIHILLCSVFIGYILLIADILKLFRSKTVTYAVCLDCGNRWKVK